MILFFLILYQIHIAFLCHLITTAFATFHGKQWCRAIDEQGSFLIQVMTDQNFAKRKRNNRKPVKESKHKEVTVIAKIPQG